MYTLIRPNLQILGNLIGLGSGGTQAYPVAENGLRIRGLVRNALIGQSGGGNVIVTDGDVGIVLLDLGEEKGAPDDAMLQANIVGMNPAGSELLGDSRDGVRPGRR